MALPTDGFSLPFGVKLLNPYPVDYWSGPYEGTTEVAALTAANTAIPPAIRFKSLEVRLIVNNVSKKYWYRDGISDGDLVEFAGGGGGTATVIESDYPLVGVASKDFTSIPDTCTEINVYGSNLTVNVGGTGYIRIGNGGVDASNYTVSSIIADTTGASYASYSGTSTGIMLMPSSTSVVSSSSFYKLNKMANDTWYFTGSITKNDGTTQTIYKTWGYHQTTGTLDTLQIVCVGDIFAGGSVSISYS